MSTTEHSFLKPCTFSDQKVTVISFGSKRITKATRSPIYLPYLPFFHHPYPAVLKELSATTMNVIQNKGQSLKLFSKDSLNVFAWRNRPLGRLPRLRLPAH